MPSIEQPSADALVTDHAALRWFQRFLGIDTGRVQGLWADDHAHLRRLCAENGVTPSVVKARIASPNVRLAIAAGASKLQVDGVWITFRGGQVATVILPEQRGRKNRVTKAIKRAHDPRRKSPQLPARSEGGLDFTANRG